MDRVFAIALCSLPALLAAACSDARTVESERPRSFDAGAPTDAASSADAWAEKDAGPTVVDRCAVEAAPAPAAPLRTLYIDAAQGNDANDGLSPSMAWKTLTKANGSAKPGDLFLVSGAFTGQYIRPAASGTPQNRITFRVARGTTASIEKAEYGTALWLVGIEYVVVDGFDIKGNADPLSMGNNDWVRNCTLHDNTGYVRIIEANNTRFEDNVVENCGDYCVWMSSATGTKFLRNKVGKSKTLAFYAWSSNNTIGFNEFDNPNDSQLFLEGGGNTVECNRFHNSGKTGSPSFYTPALRIASNDNIIRYNLVYDNKAEGIGFWIEANRNDVYHNVAWGNGGPGIRMLVDIVGKQIRNNKFRNNAFWNSNRSDDFHWTLEGKKLKVVVDTYHVQTDGWTDGTFGDNQLFHNLIGTTASEKGQPWLYMIGYTKGATLTMSEAEAKWPTSLRGNFEEEPKFFAPELGDFRPSAGSALIDRGEPIDGLPFSGSAPDVGRYEAP
jgi:hypothetical protein